MEPSVDSSSSSSVRKSRIQNPELSIRVWQQRALWKERESGGGLGLAAAASVKGRGGGMGMEGGLSWKDEEEEEEERLAMCF